MSRAPLVFNDPEASTAQAATPDLSAFRPRGAGQGAPAPAVRAAIDAATAYPSRETQTPAAAALQSGGAAQPVEGQLNIRAPVEVIERFRHLCKEDRRTYADMLRILMDERPADGRARSPSPKSPKT
jgi:hypothetical protein